MLIQVVVPTYPDLTPQGGVYASPGLAGSRYETDSVRIGMRLTYLAVQVP